MDRLVILGVAVILAVVGLLRIGKGHKRLAERIDFANEFLGKLAEYCESRGKDYSAYTWLIDRSNRMQLQMGSEGIYAWYTPAFQNYQIRNYPIILNELPALRKEFEDEWGTDLARDHVNTLSETMVRHIGILKDTQKEDEVLLRNPLLWLREGVRAVVALPLSVMAWFGVMSEGSLARLTATPVFRALAALACLLGFVSVVMNILLGWEKFVDLLHRLL